MANTPVPDLGSAQHTLYLSTRCSYLTSGWRFPKVPRFIRDLTLLEQHGLVRIRRKTDSYWVAKATRAGHKHHHALEAHQPKVRKTGLRSLASRLAACWTQLSGFTKL